MQHHLSRCLSIILAASATAVLAAPIAPRSGYSKVVVSHREEAGRDAGNLIAAVGGQAIEDYNTFTVGAVPSAAAQRLTDAARHAGISVSVRDDFDLIELPGGVIDARRGTQASNPGKTLGLPYASGERGMYIVQFAAPLKPEWAAALSAAGSAPIQYVRENTWLIAATNREIAAISANPFVQFVDILHPFLKPQAANRTVDAVPMFVQLANVPEAEDAVLEIAARSRVPLTRRVYGATELRVRGAFSADDADVILSIPLVFGMSDVPNVEYSDERMANILAGTVDSSGAPNNPGGYKTWLDGVCGFCSRLLSDGFKVGVADTGLDGGTTGGHRAELPASRITYGHAFDASGNIISDSMSDSVGHGTIVSSVAVGDGLSASGSTDSGGFYRGLGVAPSGGVFVTKPTISPPWPNSSYTPIAVSATDARGAVPPVYIQNYSQNQYTDVNAGCTVMFYDGSYSIFSREFDQTVIDSDNNPNNGVTPITLTVSAGNKHQDRYTPADDGCGDTADGGGERPRLTLPPGTAKNVIAVGASESVRPSGEQWGCWYSAGSDASNIESDSKRGTRVSTWYKPDLFAPAGLISGLRTTLLDAATDWGYCLQTTVSVGTPPPSPYFGSTGTSFAAPVAAGAALLASRVFAESGNPRCSTSCDPGAATPALLKAMLVISARSMRGGIDKADSISYTTNGTTTIGNLPNGQQGFGRIALADLLVPTPARIYINEDASTAHQGGLATGEEWSDTYTVQDGTLPVKVVLTWTDPPALQSAGSSQTAVTTSPLLNNLDLIVELVATPCTTRYLGNATTFLSQAHGEESQAYNCSTAPIDSSNNVELVKFFSSAGTQFKIRVNANSVSATSAQKFALVVYNGYRSAAAAPPAAAPTGLQATSDTTPRVVLAWNAVSGATAYDIQRKKLAPSPADANFVNYATTSFTTYTDTAVSTGATYLYRVRARSSTGMTNYCTPDVVYVMSTAFTDDPLVAASDVPTPPYSTLTPVKAVHITELRSAVDALRAAVGLPAATYTNPGNAIPNSTIAGVNITELRSALDEARSHAGAFALTYSDGSDLSTKPVRAAHIRELREGVH